MAVSDKTETKLLFIFQMHPECRSSRLSGKLGRTISIEATALNDYFTPGSRVHLLKTDIQGYELHALRGASVSWPITRTSCFFLNFGHTVFARPALPRTN